ncbi:MAG: glycosyltransferase family 2 protein [Oscillospiraceae bacterium]|nr:glycosyltransferase family 2 protein [Oscillospiraceae bacterium]
MKKALVSIITPCYNGAAVIGRMIESVLAQTYDNIEYILVNDGSKDDTERVVLSYQEQFEKRGYRFLYVKQENGGLGAAINAGLRVITGDYLCWADADDFYAPTSVEKRVTWMEAHPDYGVITSDAYIVKEGTVDQPIRTVSSGVPDNENEAQFWNLLNGESIFTPGAHMARVSMFTEQYPDRQIYPARRGQDWQLLLPMYYHYKRHFLNEPLFYYVVSDNSMSRDDSAEKVLFRCDEHEDILRHTLAGIQMPEADRKKAERQVRVNYARRRLSVAYRSGKKDVAIAAYQNLKKDQALRRKDRVYLFGAKHPWFRKIAGK